MAAWSHGRLSWSQSERTLSKLCVTLNSTKQNLQGWQLQSFLSSLPFQVWDAPGGCVQWSRRETKTSKLQQATEELGRERTARVTTMDWHCSKPDSGVDRSREKWSRTCTCVNAAQHGLELDLRDSVFLSKTRRWLRSIRVPKASVPRQTQYKNAMGNKCFWQRILFTFLSTLFIHFSALSQAACVKRN